MRVRRLVAALVTATTLAGCASATDIRATDAAKTPQASSPSHPTPGTTSSAPSPTSTAPPSESASTAPSKPPPTASSGSPRREPKHLPNVVGALPSFLTPSHNIGCAISADQVRCDINKHVYLTPPKPPDCQGDYGTSIAVTRSGIATFLCVTDTVIQPGAPVLAYGTSSVIGDFGCTSRQTGIRCYYLRSKHGFWLAQAQPAIF